MYKGRGSWGLSISFLPRFPRILVPLSSHPLSAGVAPLCLPVPPSPSSRPCSTRRSAAAAWRGTPWPGELGPRRLRGLVWGTSVCALEEGREARSAAGGEGGYPGVGLLGNRQRT